MKRVNKMVIKIERIVALASLVAACLSLVEKSIYYLGMLKRSYDKKHKQFGFVPVQQSKQFGLIPPRTSHVQVVRSRRRP